MRKPLTEVQEFNLHVDHRALDRAEFDQKVKEKEMMYKRYREESEAAKMVMNTVLAIMLVGLLLIT